MLFEWLLRKNSKCSTEEPGKRVFGGKDCGRSFGQKKAFTMTAQWC